MGIQQITMPVPYGPNLLRNLCIVIRRPAHVSDDRLVTVRVQGEDTGEIARVAHIHGIGQRGNTGPRRITTGLQVLIKDIVPIVGGDILIDRQTHLLRQQAGRQIPEVSAGNAGDKAGIRLFQTSIGMEIIKRLG